MLLCVTNLSLLLSMFMFQALKWEEITAKFVEVTGELERALAMISYDKLDISDEVKEQANFDFSDCFTHYHEILPPFYCLLHFEFEYAAFCCLNVST